MKTTSKRLQTFLSLALRTLLLLSVPAGRAAAVIPHSDEVVTLLSEHDILEALWGLETGQKLRLDLDEVQLNATLTIKASNVAIDGKGVMTRIRCPPDGGAFVIKGANLTFSRLEFTDCKNGPVIKIEGDVSEQTGSSRSGQAIGNRRDRVLKAVRLNSCVFQRNVAGRGAAVNAATGKLVVTNSTFVNNRAMKDGGAIHSTGTSIEIESSSFLNNECLDGNGGAVSVDDCQFLTLSDSTFERNSAKSNGKNEDTSRGRGGGLYVSRVGRVTVRRSHFKKNVALMGGGAAFYKIRDLALTGLTVSENFAGKQGGGFVLHTVGTSTVTKSRFEINRSDAAGGGVFCLYVGNAISVEVTTFTRNTAGRDGGGLWLSDIKQATLRAVAFKQQETLSSGGAIFTDRADLVSMSAVTLEENFAHEDGGGLCARGSAMDAGHCQFFRNNAYSGGALSLSGSSTMTIDDKVTMTSNNATLGGAVSITDSAKLSVGDDKDLLLLRNSALRGGALFCRECGLKMLHTGNLRMHFIENVATEFGGATYIVEAKSFRMADAEFVRNVASRGGGMFLEDCSYIDLRGCDFQENMAVDGGGLYVSSKQARTELYTMENVRLERNRALYLRTMDEAADHSQMKQWLRQRRRALSGIQLDWLRPEESLQARGGAMFLGLRNHREDSSVNILLLNVSAEENFAAVGGAMYVEDGSRGATTYLCPDKELDRKQCLSLSLVGAQFTKNTALVSGGGLFVRGSKSLDIYGCSVTPSSSSESSMHSCQDSVLRLHGNRILSGPGAGYGPELATGAVALELLNFDGFVADQKSGHQLLAPAVGNSPSAASEAITLVVKDALNRRVCGKTEDSELSVALLSEFISGQKRYKAENGIIRINSTFVEGYDITEAVTIQSDDARNIETTMTFSTLACPDGQLPTETKKECFRCSPQNYAFSSNVSECRLCENHAHCSGTTMLVPEEGFWHSTPFSPFIRRCPVKEACSYSGRKNALSEYYSNPEIRTKVEECKSSGRRTESTKCSGKYQQCARGYRGILCGACENAYAHSSGGKCKRCHQTLTTTWLLTGSGLLLLTAVLTAKVVLGVSGVTKFGSAILEREKRTVAFVLSRWRSHPLRSVRETVSSSDDNESPDPLSAVNDSFSGRQGEDTSCVEGSAVGSDEGCPLVKPRVEQTQKPRSGSCSKRSKTAVAAISAASGLLMATYNIFFNYIQLSSVAMTLGVDWGAPLKTFFASNSVLVRIMNIESIPFACNFNDQVSHYGIHNSTLVLWCRVCFPLVVVIMYATTTLSTKMLRKKSRMTKDKTNFAPPIQSIFLVVYLASYIDLVSDFASVLNCRDLSSAYQADHPYRDFEDLDLVSVWLEDTDVTCWTGEHLVSTVVAATGLCVCLGIVLFMVGVLARGSYRGRLKQPEFVRRYGILYLGYRTEGLALHWESVITIRKMLFAGIGVYASRRQTPGIHTGLLAIVVYVSLALHDVVQPFEDKDMSQKFPAYAGSEVRFVVPRSVRNRWVAFNRSVTLNGLEGASLFMSLCFFLVAGCVYGERATSNEASVFLGMCFCLNGIFFLFMVYRLWYGLHQYLDALAGEHDISDPLTNAQVSSRKTYLPLKVWRALSANKRHKEDAIFSAEA